MTRALHIVGGGMAGSEAAWQAAELGIPVVIHEMRPKVGTFAHRTGNLAEMVCSNSFRSDDDEQNAVGLLHWEMRAAGGLIMEMADRHRLPAGGALAVDRDPFAEAVTERLKSHPNITVEPLKSRSFPSDGTGSSPPAR
jgi:methylenetetrahydrofolate--tRNA-(uracil-5-)-methyltransferase